MARPDDQFGLCPVCHRTNGYLIVAGRRWFRSDAHKLVWYTSPDWSAKLRPVGPATERENRARMAGYRRVVPFFWR